uniref:asparagine synthase (glutamine-hydrolyzing) n=1 Tax=Magnetococcus massalia (strain MO-1) TaxID=451514 RepID=A0A1S7LPG3_MAGMO|nr:Putative asparagine synthase (Glutamine-hydrolyzing) [Candidatus Magnetococcus massalia]
MCGLVAEAGRLSRPKRRAAAHSALTHRGPDHAGEWGAVEDETEVWLAHRRLSIVDTSEAGHQPLHNRQQTLHLVANGEIYNAPTLRTRLQGLGHHFSSHSDSEVILHAYAQWGVACLEQLTGMFAFVLWDSKNQKLFAARDRLGIKPLFYAPRGDGSIALASEASALKFLKGSRKKGYDPAAISHVLAFGYVPDPLSIWNGMRKLGPGQLLTWQPDQPLTIRTWWSPPDATDDRGDDHTWRQRFLDVLDEHLLADVPLSLLLSGGLDSHAVAVGMQRLGQSVEAFSMGFADPAQDESAMAAQSAERLGLPFTRCTLDEENLPTLLDEVTRRMDEPQLYGSFLTMAEISRQVAKRYKVVLSGDGGDELFAGYNWYRNLHEPLNRHAPLKRALARPFAQRLSLPHAMGQKMRTAFNCSSALHRHAWRTTRCFMPEEITALLTPRGIHLSEAQFLAPLQRYHAPNLPLVRNLQRIDLMTFCSNHICAKVDRASMAHALEVRVPFLDHRLVEWAISRPEDPNEQQHAKPLLRADLQGAVPDSLFERRKQGFSLRSAKLHGDDSLFTLEINGGPLIEQGWLRRDWQRFIHGDDPQRHSKLWRLSQLSRWMRHHPEGVAEDERSGEDR